MPCESAQRRPHILKLLPKFQLIGLGSPQPCRQRHAVVPSETEKAEIEIHEGDDLYREIRVENVVKDQESGEEAHLKPGAEVDVIVEADSSATIKKPE